LQGIGRSVRESLRFIGLQVQDYIPYMQCESHDREISIEA
jgi:hypothetical protein